MARTPGTDAVLAAAEAWRDRCLLVDGSVFTDRALWTRAHLAELHEHFVEHPDAGDRSFLEKLRDQLEPATPGAVQLAAELLWAVLLFPSNVGREKKVENVTTVWGWSGESLPTTHPMLAGMGAGVGSGGQAYNTLRWRELQFLIAAAQDWKALAPDAQLGLAVDPWAFAAWLDTVEGAPRRQFRHMALHLLFPDTFERVSSPDHKERIEAAFADRIPPPPLRPEETGTTHIARDRRLLRIREALARERDGAPLDFYQDDLLARWRPPVAAPKTAPPAGQTQQGSGSGTTAAAAAKSTDGVDDGAPDARAPNAGAGVGSEQAPDLGTVAETLARVGLKLPDRTLRRYHLALSGRGFVILAGVSGTGKTWLAEAYAEAVGAKVLVVPVAPNWTSNEDLLGFADPVSGAYRDTAFSRFLREAAADHAASRREGRSPRAYHLVLDELNLARVEFYFAAFLSAMEQRLRAGDARVALGPAEAVPLPPTLKFVGTVNVDETTHGFADKVYDRAQVIELEAPREAVAAHLAGAPYRDALLAVWDAVRAVAPFAFRVLDDAARYVADGAALGVPWEELVDEVVLQKVLPKLRGTDPRVGDALDGLDAALGAEFPLSAAKVAAMRDAFQQHGVASYF